VAEIDDPLERIQLAIHAFLAFFDEHPDYVELLVQERAIFKDRQKPAYFLHRELNVERWRILYRGLIADGRVRQMPVERITDVVSDLLYGTIFNNYFSGRPRKVEAQARDIIDMLFHGFLSDSQRTQMAH